MTNFTKISRLGKFLTAKKKGFATGQCKIKIFFQINNIDSYLH